MHLDRIKRCYRLWQCLLLSVLPALNVAAQHTDLSPLWVHYNSQNSELSNNTVYAAETDSKGYTWFCTANGLYQFNGRNIIRTFKEELPEHTEFINFFKDRHERLWLMGFEGRLFRVDLRQSSLREIHYTSDSVHRPANKPTIYYGYDGKDGVHLLNSSFAEIVIGQSGSIKKLSYPPVSYYNTFLNRYHVTERHYPLTFPGEAVLQSRITNGHYICYNKVYAPVAGDALYCLFDGTKYGITEQIIDVDTSGEDLLLAVYSARGRILRIHQYRNIAGPPQIDTLLHQAFLTGIREDKYHNIWATTYNNGIFMLPRHFTHASLFPLSALPHTGKLIALNAAPQSIQAIADNGFIYQFDQQLHFSRRFAYGSVHNNTGTIQNDNNLFALSGTAVYQLPYGAAKMATLPVDRTISPKKLLQADTSQLLVLSKTNIASYQFRNRQTTWLYQGKHNITAAALSSDNRLWVAISDSLFRIDLNREPRQRQMMISNCKVNALRFYKDTLWAATSDGIYYFSHGQRLISATAAPLKGQLFTDCKQVKLYPDYILGIYQQGIQLFRRQSSQPVYQYHTNNSLYHFILEDALIDNETLYLATDKGLIAQPLAQLLPLAPYPQLYFNEYKTNNEHRQHWSGDTLTLQYLQQQTITLSFDYLNGDQAHTQFWYSLNTPDEEWPKWIKILSNEIILDQLRPGTYHLVLKSRENGNNAPDITASKWIIIAPRWYQTKLFLATATLLSIICGSLLIWGLASLRIRRKQAHSQREKSLLEMEGRAMLNQLNPHFVFNALNPLQYYIASRQNQEALQYLQKFAGLFRKMLQMSSDNNNTIAEELRFLEEYLFIQRTRYDEHFDYTLSVGDQTNLQQYLPPMLVQPLVENAIEHGVMGMQEKGTIDISISTESMFITVRVTDSGNGPGDDESVVFKKGHALYIVQERLKLMKGKNGISGTFSILRDNDHTVFLLKIPVTLQNHNHAN